MASFGNLEEEEMRTRQRMSSISSRISSYSGSLRYRNLKLDYSNKEDAFFDLKIATHVNEGPEIAASADFWGCSWSGGGGPVYVSKHSAVGKVEPDCPVINGHSSAVHDICFSPYESNVLATASADCSVKIWSLSTDQDAPLVSQSAEDAKQCIKGFGSGVRTAKFHPTVRNLLACTTLDRKIHMHCVESGSEVYSTQVGGDDSLSTDAGICNLSFNGSGSLFAVSCKDKSVRVLDPRTNGSKPVQSVTGTLGRNLRVEWCFPPGGGSGPGDQGGLLTASVVGGMRTLHVFDPRQLSEPLCTRVMDDGSGQLLPMWDDSMGCVVIAGKGDTILRCYELATLLAADLPGTGAGETETEPLRRMAATCEKACEFTALTDRTPYTGACLLPKHSCDVRGIQCARVLKLTKNSVVPASLSLPRAASLRDYFQDDIYHPIQSSVEHTSVPEYQSWQSDADAEMDLPRHLVSLCPEGMQPLSERPVETEVKVSRVTSFRQQQAQQEAEKNKKDESFAKLQQLAMVHAQANPNKSMGAAEVDSDDNWSDSD